jgi:hypothetical protein
MSSLSDLRHLEPDQFHAMVKMHLSFLLDLNTDDCESGHIYNSPAKSSKGSSTSESTKKTKLFFTPKKSSLASSLKSTNVMSGAALTMEGVCQAYQLIQVRIKWKNSKWKCLTFSFRYCSTLVAST